jgi:hypothetical protein
MDGCLGRGRANLTLQPDGRYAGYLHLDDGDRPFTGTIVTFGPRGGRYAGTDGEGIVTVRRERGHAMLVFVPDGGGARSAFERAKYTRSTRFPLSRACAATISPHLLTTSLVRLYCKCFSIRLPT